MAILRQIFLRTESPRIFLLYSVLKIIVYYFSQKLPSKLNTTFEGNNNLHYCYCYCLKNAMT